MYVYKKGKWNQLDTIAISNDRTGDEIVVAPGLGAAILELSLSGKTWISVDKDFPENYRFQSAILSPFPNKIRNGEYTFSGKEYSLKKNDITKKNAAHGLLYKKPFAVESIDCSGKCASISLGYTYDKDDDGYPFKYHFSVMYLLKSESDLNIVFQTTNLSNGNIPYGMGFHPYFRMDYPLDKIWLTIPKCEKLVCDSENFPTGDRQVWNYFSNGNYMDMKTSYNDCFYVGETEEKFSIDIAQGKNNPGFKVWFETGRGKFNYFQLYTRKGSYEIAIEPMTCAPNVFNNQEGITLMEPHETLKYNMGLMAMSKYKVNSKIT